MAEEKERKMDDLHGYHYHTDCCSSDFINI